MSKMHECNQAYTFKSPGMRHCELRYELLEPLLILLESSYKLGKLLDEWKLGHVTAVYKKGNKGDPSNYRPTSLTSIICKLPSVL